MKLLDKLVQQQALVARLRTIKLARETNWQVADRHALDSRALWNRSVEAYAEALKTCQGLMDKFLDDGPDKEVEE